MNKKHAKRIKELSDKLPQRQDGWNKNREMIIGEELIKQGKLELFGEKVLPNKPYYLVKKTPRMVSMEGRLREIYKMRGGIDAVEAYALAVLAHETQNNILAEREFPCDQIDCSGEYKTIQEHTATNSEVQQCTECGNQKIFP